jgi:hypothetical protein
MRTVALCEIEAFAIANLVAKKEAGLMDPAPIWTDLKTFPWEEFRDKVDVLSGGYPASHSAQPGSDLEQTTQDIFGPTSQAAFDFFDQSSASSRTSKDTLALDSEKSLENWKNLVTKRRGEYSQRLNAARRISESGCLLWPTIRVKQAEDCTSERKRKNPSLDSIVKQQLESGLAAQGNHSTHGNRPESWLTPRANEPEADSNFVARNADRGEHCHVSLTMQAKAWATPRAEMDSGAHRGKPDTLHSQIKAWATPEGMAGGKTSRGGNRKGELLLTGQVKQDASGKLNPRWVETLMGLPIGWTMPSCASPVTIAQTNCAYLATE